MKWYSLYLWEVKCTIRNQTLGNSLAVQWLGHFPFTDKGTSSIVGQGTKIMQSVWYGQNKTHTHNLKKNGGGRWEEVLDGEHL